MYLLSFFQQLVCRDLPCCSSSSVHETLIHPYPSSSLISVSSVTQLAVLLIGEDAFDCAFVPVQMFSVCEGNPGSCMSDICSHFRSCV